MIPVDEQLPEENEMTKCIVNVWRYGKIHHSEEVEATYLGMNGMIGKPMWDIETYDEDYAEVTHWESLKTTKKKSDKLSDMTPGRLKALYSESLRLDRLIHYEDTAKRYPVQIKEG